MAIFKRGRVYWYHFIFSGQHIQESTKQGNPRVARQIEAAHKTSLAKGEMGIRDKKKVPTLAAFCHERVEPWMQAMFEQTSNNTWRWYRAGLRSIYDHKPLANLRLDQITAETGVAFCAHRQALGLQVASVNASLRILRRVLKLAQDWAVLAAVPKIKLLRGERHRERVITQQEEAVYLAVAPDPLSSIVSVLADTGMRPEECHRLRWENIAFTNGRHGTLLITQGKTAAARRILPLTPRVREVLECRWEASGKPGEGWIWPAQTKSGHADHSTVKKQHIRALKLSGVRSFVLYSLRHTFLTRLAESGCDVWTLARIAGWSDISISKRYVHPSDDAVLAALARLPVGHSQLELPSRTGEAAQ